MSTISILGTQGKLTTRGMMNGNGTTQSDQLAQTSLTCTSSMGSGANNGHTIIKLFDAAGALKATKQGRTDESPFEILKLLPVANAAAEGLQAEVDYQLDWNVSPDNFGPGSRIEVITSGSMSQEQGKVTASGQFGDVGYNANFYGNGAAFVVIAFEVV